MLPGSAARKLGGARQPDHATGATQAEDRQALDVAAQTHALHQQRVKAGRGDAGGGDHHDGVNIVGVKSSFFQKTARDLLQQVHRILDVKRGAIESSHARPAYQSIGTQE